MRLRVTLRTGDRAIIAGVAAIAVYEKLVRDDADLISNRVACYRGTLAGRVLTDAVILATALHLMETLEPRWDVYHHAMRAFRKKVQRADPKHVAH